MALSSLGLIAGKAASMALGFLFWLLAARWFDAGAVGLAAAAVSGMMLCVQVALLGAGSAFIAEYPAHRQRPSELLDTTLSLVMAASMIAAFVFLFVAAQVMGELQTLLAVPAFVPLFVAVTALGAVGVALDQISMALGRGDHVVTRNVAGGMVVLVALASLLRLGGEAGPVALFGLWLAGAASSFGLGMSQLRAAVPGYRYRVGFDAGSAKRLVRLGLPNYVLTLVDRTPGLVIPLVVTEVLSADANAYWYAVWMTAWAVYVVPVSVGTALYAEVCHRPRALATSTRHAVRTALGVGVAAAAMLGFAAEMVLSLLGANYAATGATPLRILLVAVLPLTFVQAWFAVCRAQGHLGEAVATGAVGGAVAILATAAAGAAGGLAAMAVAWSTTQALMGCWCMLRLRRCAWADHSMNDLAPMWPAALR